MRAEGLVDVQCPVSEMGSELVLEESAGAVLLRAEEGTDRLSREDLIVEVALEGLWIDAVSSAALIFLISASPRD